jgi:hypothetical protein
MPGKPGAKNLRERKRILVRYIGDWVKAQESLFEMIVPPRAASVTIKCRPCREAIRRAEQRKAKKAAKQGDAA